MIRFGVEEVELLAAIDLMVPTWRTRAKARTKAVVAAGGVGEGDGIWSEIKTVFMELQGFKCMYCEKPMPKGDEGAMGKGEYDVEHFRPKNRAAKWPTAEVKKRRGITYEAKLGAGVASGYVWLAFDPLNYGVSCKTCNSELKGDRFPILGKAGRAGATYARLDESEKPCLLLPLLEGADDPEHLLEWTGPLVRPRKGLPATSALRARVIIDFFELDTRRDLLEQRCRAIALVAPKLPRRATDPNAQRFIDALTDDDACFAACLRAFVKLYDAKPLAARDWADRCEGFIATKGKIGLT